MTTNQTGYDERFYETDEFKDMAEHYRAHVMPTLAESSVSLMMPDPENVDIRFALELGLSIMFDKPILTVALPGVEIPEHLVRVSDKIVRMDAADDPAFQEKMKQALEEMSILAKGDAE